MADSKRLKYFDMAKGIGVFLVLLGHLQGDSFFSLSPYVLPLCTWIFSFHMPLFFIISGMLINYKKDSDKEMKTLITKRFKGIMIPYLWFSLFYFLVVVFAYIKGTIRIETLLNQAWYVISLYGMNVLWFLPALFLGEILFLFIYKRFAGKITAILITTLTTIASTLNFLLSRIEPETSFIEKMTELADVILRPIFACSFIALGFFIFSLLKQREKSNPLELAIGFIMTIANIFLHKLNGGVDFRSLVFNNLLLYYVCALLGSVGLILLCKNIPDIKPISAFGASSLIVMAVHNNETVLYLGLKLSMIVNQYITRARGYISYALVVLVILLYCVIMIYLINHFFGFIIAKPSPFDKIIDKLLHKKESRDLKNDIKQ